MTTVEETIGRQPPGIEEWFMQAVNSLARGEPDSVKAFFHTVGKDTIIDETKTTCRIHWLVDDGNERPRLQALAARLAIEVVDYCIPRERLQQAMTDFKRSGSSSQLMRLQAEARSYFSGLLSSGEGGELLLFFLMESGLGIPQILCKMPLKTNSNMMIHGVDGVHAKALPNGNLAVYWGESKIYGNFQQAASECFTSIAPYLKDEGGGPLTRDIMLVRDYLNAEQSELSIKLAAYFTDDSPERQKLEVRGACLIGFTHENFKTPFSEDGQSVTAEVVELIAGWHRGIKSRVINREIEVFEIEFFCLPIPSADDFRRYMREALGIDSGTK
jgi:hypothetical protein